MYPDFLSEAGTHVFQRDQEKSLRIHVDARPSRTSRLHSTRIQHPPTGQCLRTPVPHVDARPASNRASSFACMYVCKVGSLELLIGSFERC